MMLRVMEKAGADMNGHRSKTAMSWKEWDVIVTVCSHAEKRPRLFTGESGMRSVKPSHPLSERKDDEVTARRRCRLLRFPRDDWKE